MEVCGPVEVLVAARIGIEIDVQKALYLESGVNVTQIFEAADEKAGASEESQRECDLSQDQAFAQAPHYATNAARTLLKRGVWISGRGAQGGPEAEEHSREDGHSGSKGEHSQVRLEIQRCRDNVSFGKNEIGKSSATPQSKDQPGQSSEDRQHHALGECLANEPPATSAQRNAKPHFVAPRCGARQDEAGEVSAGDE